MRLLKLGSFGFALTVFAASALHAVPVLVNGSLTGAIDNGGVPPGWTVLSGSPDTMDQNNNVGVPGNTQFVTAPAGPSPDGGTWVGFAHDGGFIERFGQLVAGFSVGTEYTVSWYVGNFGFSGTTPQYAAPNAVEVLLDGLSVGAGGVVPSASGWTLQSINFVATGASQQLAFQPLLTDRSYISIDGINLVEARNGVPEPASGVLIGVGLLAITLLGRRTLASRQG